MQPIEQFFPELSKPFKGIITCHQKPDGDAMGSSLALYHFLKSMGHDVKVIAADIHLGVLEEFQKEIGTDRLLILKSDITSAEGAAKVVKESAQWAKSLTGLEVTAGNSTNHSSLELTPEQWKEVRDCHLDGHFYMNQAFARHLVANKTGGAIVNFSSVAHIFGWPRRLPYAVAKAGIDALKEQISAVAGTDAGTNAGDVRNFVTDLGPFPAPLALNVIPWAGSLKQDGYSSEELKVRNESRKILGLPNLKVSATCVRVPVITTHSLTVHAVFEKEPSRKAAQDILQNAAGVKLVDDPENYKFPTPADVVGTDPTWVGRVRKSIDDPMALDMFVCGDNLRKGAALNTAQIAELLAVEFTA